MEAAFARGSAGRGWVWSWEGSGAARSYSIIPGKSCRPEQKLMRGGGQWDLAAKSLQRTRRPIRGGPTQWLGWVLSPPTPHPRMCPPSTLVGRGGGSWGSGPVLPVGRGLSASLLPLIRREMKEPHGHPSGGVGGVEQPPLPGEASSGSPTHLHRVRETPKVPICRVTVPPTPPQSRAGQSRGWQGCGQPAVRPLDLLHVRDC